MPFLRRLIVFAAVLCAVVPPVSAAGQESGRLFAPDSPWNLPLRDDVPLHPDSQAYVDTLVGLVKFRGAWLNSSSCGMPLYWADPETPRVTVKLNHPSYMDPGLVAAWSSVPWPADAKPARCSDKNLAIAQRQPDGTVDMWEFWSAVQLADGTWEARWGGATEDVANDRGFASHLAWTNPWLPPFKGRSSGPGWNVTASSGAMAAGVVTAQEIAAGRIDHALAFAVTSAAKGKWFFPAQRGDGWITDPFAIPEGARFRIDPSVDLDKLPMSPMIRMLAEAAQRYGLIVRDQTGGVNVFYFEEPAPGQPNVFAGLLDGQPTGTAVKAFPWDRLQLVDAPSCSDWSGCEVTPTARIDFDVTPELGVPLRLDTSNSALNYPRAAMAWDLDGDGTYETDGGRSVAQFYVPQSLEARTIGVRITTRDGAQVAGERTIAVGMAPDSGATTPSAPVAPASSTGLSKSAPSGAAGVPTATSPARPGSTVLRLVGRHKRTIRGRGRLVLTARVTPVPAARAPRVRVAVERRSGRRWRVVERVRASARGRVRWSRVVAGRPQARHVYRLRLTGAAPATASVVVRFR